MKTGGKGNLDLGLQNKVGAEVMAQWSGALTACPLHLSSAPSTHDGQLTTAYNSSSRLSSGLCKLHMGTFIHMHKYTQNNNSEQRIKWPRALPIESNNTKINEQKTVKITSLSHQQGSYLQLFGVCTHPWKVYFLFFFLFVLFCFLRQFFCSFLEPILELIL